MTDWAVASDLDRVDHQRRDQAWIATRWEQPGVRLLPLDADARFVTRADGTALATIPPRGSYDDQRHHLLGVLDGVPVFCVDDADAAPETPSELRGDLRTAGHQLTPAERDVAVAAAAVVHWHRSAPCCPRCGGPTRVVHGGFARHCTVCEEEHFPRTDPAVIVAVVDDQDRLLLGGQASWGHRVSVLAGFVEAGESLEQTVHREIAEESGIALSDLVYFGSQPWPFPRSLMVGFFARAVSTEIDVTADDLAHADWYQRDQLTEALETGRLGLPGASSIAARLIEAWRSGRGPL